MSARVVVVLAVMLWAPGWAILLLSGAWRPLAPLSRWAVALACSVAFYPPLFYTARLLRLPLHAPALILVLACALVIIIGYVWRTGAAHHLPFDRLEWTAVAILVLSIGTRAWVAIEYPFPAWADSLHHTLITKITIEQGMLPRTLDPYFPISLSDYHLGFHAIASAFGILSGVPPHTAVHWTTQILNGLAGLGVYVVVDRFSGRRGAVLALAAIGVFWMEPAVYVNYGRSTQLSANLLVLFAWVAIVDVTRGRAGSVAVTSLLCAGVALLHFRDLIVLALLAVPTLAWLILREGRGSRARVHLAAVAAVAAIALFIALPAIGPAFDTLVSPRVMSVWHSIRDGSLSAPIGSYAYSNLFTRENLGRYDEMWIAIGVGGLVVLWRRSKLGLAMLGWLAMLGMFLLVASMHPALPDVMNPGFVFLILYLPAGVLVGVAVNLLLPERVGRSWLFVPAVIVSALIALPRTLRIAEPFRFFMTRDDIPAMGWIREQTPPTARFAVSTMWWIDGGIAHGVDGGYWIPYFAERTTTTGCLLPGQFSYFAKFSADVVALERGEDRVAALAARGVTHIYIGARGSSLGLDATVLKKNPALRVVFEERGVTIFEIL